MIDNTNNFRNFCENECKYSKNKIVKIEQKIWDGVNTQEVFICDFCILDDFAKMIKDKLDKHVYCTKCFYFSLDDEGMPYCYFENICDINNYEDSMPLRNRPYYKGNYENL
jgi:hypothetical protein